uniref:Uncharacterized protein n=1 Tax=Caenorhabditis japonica TaxID=281687 RepID=A0A8R1HZ72_CAEJA
MTGDIKKEKEAKAVNQRKQSSWDSDDDELVAMGSSPVIVFTQSKKMSIYGPNFSYGPLQLRRQRLLEKARKERAMKREADLAMEKKIAELRAAQKEQEDYALFNVIVDRIQEQDRLEKLAAEKYFSALQCPPTTIPSIHSSPPQYFQQMYQQYQLQPQYLPLPAVSEIYQQCYSNYLQENGLQSTHPINIQ